MRSNLEVVKGKEECFGIESVKDVREVEVGVEAAWVVGRHGAGVVRQVHSVVVVMVEMVVEMK